MLSIVKVIVYACESDPIQLQLYIGHHHIETWTKWRTPDSKVHGANMGPILGRQDPGGPHVGPMNFAIWDILALTLNSSSQLIIGLTNHHWTKDNSVQWWYMWSPNELSGFHHRSVQILTFTGSY